MNITIITSSLPYPLNSGGAQAQYNFINELRSEHHIAIICPENGKNKHCYFKMLQERWPDVELHPYPYVKQLLHFPFLRDKMVRAYQLKTKPNDEKFQVERALKPYGYNLSKAFVSFVLRVIQKHNTDLIQVDFYPYLHITHHLPANIKKLFVQHEIRYVRNRRLLSNIRLTDVEKHYFEVIRQTEIDDLNLYDQIIALTQTDKEVMMRDGVTTPITVSPAAVNTPILPYQQWNGRLTFVGGYSHIPNQEGMDWFIANVLPFIDMDKIKAIDVVGAGWPERYNTINPKIHFLGFVENLQEAIYSSLLVVPILTGSGMRMKILDAAAMGIPFITTTVGVEGLDFHHGDSCIIADKPEDFAHAINQLIADNTKMKMYADNAQSTFCKKYSVKALSEIRNNTYLQAVNCKWNVNDQHTTHAV